MPPIKPRELIPTQGTINVQNFSMFVNYVKNDKVVFIVELVNHPFKMKSKESVASKLRRLCCANRSMIHV